MLDAIDLYQLHMPDPRIPVEESVGGLADLRREGKIRHIGLSNVSADQLAAARRVAPIAGVQNRFSVAGPRDDAVLATCQHEGIAYLPWYPLECGSRVRLPGGRGGSVPRAVDDDRGPLQVRVSGRLSRFDLPGERSKRGVTASPSLSTAALQNGLQPASP